MASNRKILLGEKSSIIFENVPESSNSFDVLESAWNALPQDMTHEERIAFIEIVERLIKINVDTHDHFLSSRNSSKN